MRPEVVLELIVSAPQRYDTVRAALRYRGDGGAMKTLRDRYLVSEAYRLEGGGSPDPSEEVRYPEPDGPFGWRCRVWYAKLSPERGERERLEVELPEEVYPGGGVDISAWDGMMVGPSGMDSVMHNRIGGVRARTTPPGSAWPRTASGAPTCSIPTGLRAFRCTTWT